MIWRSSLRAACRLGSFLLALCLIMRLRRKSANHSWRGLAHGALAQRKESLPSRRGVAAGTVRWLNCSSRVPMSCSGYGAHFGLCAAAPSQAFGVTRRAKKDLGRGSAMLIWYGFLPNAGIVLHEPRRRLTHAAQMSLAHRRGSSAASEDVPRTGEVAPQIPRVPERRTAIPSFLQVAACDGVRRRRAPGGTYEMAEKPSERHARVMFPLLANPDREVAPPKEALHHEIVTNSMSIHRRLARELAPLTGLPALAHDCLYDLPPAHHSGVVEELPKHERPFGQLPRIQAPHPPVQRRVRRVFVSLGIRESGGRLRGHAGRPGQVARGRILVRDARGSFGQVRAKHLICVGDPTKRRRRLGRRDPLQRGSIWMKLERSSPKERAELRLGEVVQDGRRNARPLLVKRVVGDEELMKGDFCGHAGIGHGDTESPCAQSAAVALRQRKGTLRLLALLLVRGLVREDREGTDMTGRLVDAGLDASPVSWFAISTRSRRALVR